MISDERLCALFQGGDEHAFDVLLERHAGMVGYHARGYGTRGDDHDDMLQLARLGFLKAARLFSPNRGSGFRSYAEMSVRRKLFTHVRLMGGLKHQALDRCARFEQPVTLAHEDSVELGELILGPPSEDPCLKLIAREEFHEFVESVVGASRRERSAVAHRLNGGTYADSPDLRPKQIDNALQRVRRRLAA